ncbi:hypothetical protein, partial [Pseudomonas gingeri]|uniref:hypothetical protein n=1 Tax=Pseudomonas gingeri TaxID=117681 RepID=UPI001CA4DC94
MPIRQQWLDLGDIFNFSELSTLPRYRWQASTYKVPGWTLVRGEPLSCGSGLARESGGAAGLVIAGKP